MNVKFSIPHYYGDTVRWLFMVAAIIMALTLPIVHTILNIPIIVSTFCILILGVAAGLTNPNQIWDAAINVIISMAGFLVFDTTAIWIYQQQINTDPLEKFFLASTALGLIFLAAVYFSIKTLRGLIIKERTQ